MHIGEHLAAGLSLVTSHTNPDWSQANNGNVVELMIPRSAWSQVSIDYVRTLVVAFVPLAACTISHVIYERLSRCLVAISWQNHKVSVSICQSQWKEVWEGPTTRRRSQLGENRARVSVPRRSISIGAKIRTLLCYAARSTSSLDVKII